VIDSRVRLGRQHRLGVEGLTDTEEARVRAMMAGEFGPEFRIELTYPASIVRTEAGKLRTFVSELTR